MVFVVRGPEVSRDLGRRESHLAWLSPLADQSLPWPQVLSGGTESGENGGGEGFRVGEHVSISGSYRRARETHHMGDRIDQA